MLPDTAAPDKALDRALERNRLLGERLASPEFDREPLDRLQHWQQERLGRTYADLYRQPRYQKACAFFLDEIYGGLDFDARNRQLERVAPVMKRLLPGPMLAAVAEALDLQALSLEFDCQMAELLAGEGAIDQASYARAYRQQGDFAGRKRQVRLIRHLGEALDDVVHRPGVHKLVRMMRFPARASGFGALQDFLEQGLEAFAAMDGAGEFLQAIEDREIRAIDAIRAGQDKPFGE